VKHPLLRALLLAFVAAGCETPGPGTAVARSQTRVAPSCASLDEAPLRTGLGIDDIACVAVGAAHAEGTDEWPDATAAAEPVAYVRPGAAPGGDGARARPFATIAQALDAPRRPRTLLLARGRHPAPGVALTADAALVGRGADVTTLFGTAAAPVLRVAGAATRVALTALAVRHEGPAPAPAEASLVEVAEGALALREVSLDGGYDVLRARDAVVEGEGVTVRRGLHHGVFAVGRGRVALTRFDIRDNGAQGVRLEGPHAVLSRGQVADNARHGVVLMGSVDGVSGRARCFGENGGGGRDCVERVTFLRNGVAGLFVEGTRTLEARRILAAGTRLADVGGGAAGDGLVVGAAATVVLDDDLTDVARRGFGSAFVDNARVGVLAQGVGASVSVRGALVAANRAGGVLLAASAAAPVIGESLLEANALGGIVVTPGATVGIVQCNGIAETRIGTIATTAGTVSMADGIHVNGGRGEPRFVDNEVSGSARFGLLVNASRATLIDNRGVANLYGVGAYGDAVIVGDRASIVGRATAPTATPPLLAGL